MILVREDDMNAQSGDRFYRLYDEKTELELRVEQQCRIDRVSSKVVWGAVRIAGGLHANTLTEGIALHALLGVALQKMAEWNGDIGHDHPMQKQMAESAGVAHCTGCSTTGLIEGPYAENPPNWRVEPKSFGDPECGVYCVACQKSRARG